MCLIIFAYRCLPPYDLIIAANRDEYYARPSMPMRFWPDHPYILAGRDLEQGGTWMGITKKGRFAAITNYRDPGSFRDTALSRGLLVSNFLMGRETPEEYLRKISKNKDAYNGFNLLISDKNGLYYYSNREDIVRQVEPGVHGLSNHLLDTGWPKVRHGINKMRSLTEKRAGENSIRIEDALWEILSDESRPPDRELPQTGVPLHRERMLAPAFIKSAYYGTRSCTLLLADVNGAVSAHEKYLNENHIWENNSFLFSSK